MRERLLTKVRRWKIKRKGSWRSEGEREKERREGRKTSLGRREDGRTKNGKKMKIPVEWGDVRRRTKEQNVK